ncbi:O-antigen translocase [Chryseobacterium sp. Ch-15]|uniref:O-antigen translocase n=1 Tax=Chryseobacterium muglaense TaxID=2893752 RepID=A0A9Q3V025_9FLAO|nr:O-antigen translocase [Chryseobacterium muglaense]MBD3905448.1 O-antigen translocase [Chryseobacterium muglaense]MCC9036479.1 O-antigen translocase [Chryseobacterium muglaense]MCM2555404.1 O-antigen translocase [Chryseobacterium muglaense]
MKFGKTALYSGLITVSKTLAGFISTKVVALIVGPPGVAVIGAFINFIAIVLAFGNGAITNGIIKYTAEYTNNINKSFKLFNTALVISFVCSLVCCAILFVFSKYLSILIFTNDQYSFIIKFLGFFLLFYSLNTLLISILNGRGLINLYTIVNTIGSLFSVVLTCVLVYFYKVQGALYALVLSQSVIFIFTFYFFFRKTNFQKKNFRLEYNKIIGKKLFKYSFMAIISALTVPVSQILIRNIIIDFEGVNSAGFWQGIMKISDAYLLVVLTALGTYYLPKLSSTKDNSLIKKEILQGYKYILPVTLLGLIIVYFCRNIIIQILYDDRFLQMNDLFLWQLVGDFFKITAYLLSYVMLAKAQMKLYIATEIIFSASYILFSYLFITTYGVIGATYAFALNYFIYMIVLFINFRKLLTSRHAEFKF